MRGNIAHILALLGISCFLYIVVWLDPEIKSLLTQGNDLARLGLFEEAAPYKHEAMALSRWMLPLAMLGFFLLIPLSFYILFTSKKHHDKKK